MFVNQYSMLSIGQNVQECDASTVGSSTTAYSIKIFYKELV